MARRHNYGKIDVRAGQGKEIHIIQDRQASQLHLAVIP